MYYLTADIGGTNARFSLFEKRENSYFMLTTSWISSHKKSFTEIYKELYSLDERFSPENIESCVFAVAGPIENENYGVLTNLSWDLDVNELRNDIPNFPPVKLVNDFSAQAMSFVHKREHGFIQLFADRTKASYEYPILVAGAGTGFGVSALHMKNSEVVLAPSEGGHQICPFYLSESFEVEFSNFICKELSIDFATLDNVLTGSGLQLINTFITGEVIPSVQIPSDAKAFKYFSIWLARALRNLALTLLPSTIVLTGGISAKHEHIFSDDFYKEFTNSRTHHSYLKTVSLYLNKDENVALYGCTEFL